MDWNERINHVFTTRPRNGAEKGILWVERKDEQKKFSSYLAQEDHICIDGPTGSGKSSLVATKLYGLKQKHIAIQLSRKLTWEQFCTRLVDPKYVNTNSIGAELEIGVDKGLPTGKLSFSLGSSGSDNDDIDYLIKQSKTWTEHDLCKKLQEADIPLILDDVERCNDDLLERLSDAARIQFQSYPSKKGKMVFIGAGGIMPRLIKANKSLGHRINHISLGAFEDMNYSWHFLLEGFNSLGMRHPANSRYKDQIKQRDTCVKMTYYAADGLPKSLNRLGKNIAISSGEGRHANASTIINESRQMFLENWRNYSTIYTSIANLLKSDQIAGKIVKLIWKRGMGAVIETDYLRENIVDKKTPGDKRIKNDEFESSLSHLIDLDFITLSGKSRDTVFATDPASAHTFGVAMHNPSLFIGAKELMSGLQQLEIDFSKVTD